MEQEYFVTSNYIENIHESSFKEESNDTGDDDTSSDKKGGAGKYINSDTIAAGANLTSSVIGLVGNRKNKGVGRDCKAMCKSQGYTLFKGLGKCKRECKRSGGANSGANTKMAELPVEEPKHNYLLWGSIALILVIIIVIIIVVMKRKKK